MFSHTVLKRFVKDYSLPIQLIREPYFDYFINLYDEHLNTKDKYNLLYDTVNKCGNEQNFIEQYHKIKDTILDVMKNNSIFNDFNNSKLDEYNIPINNFCKHDIFNEGNIRKYFVSIDLKEANFQAMKYYNKDLVLGFNNYDDFMRNFTELEYMIQSKYIRQVIFGKLNPKKQIKIQQYLTYNLLENLIKEEFIDKENIKMVSADEIVFEIHENDIYNFDMEFEVTHFIKDNYSLNVDIEIFKLNQIKSFKFFVKEFVNKFGYELMCVPMIYYAQAYKIYNNLKINDYDLSFFYENQVARFLEPLKDKEIEENESRTDSTKIE